MVVRRGSTVTILSVINEYEKGGLRMMDLESMIKSLRLAWNEFLAQQKDPGRASYNTCWEGMEAFSLFTVTTTLKIIRSLLSSILSYYSGGRKWWSKFTTGNDWENILWNNKNIRIDKTPVFYKRFYESNQVI